ncbi:MAG TPA: TetR/AcrR family transcriptional regulator [Solirubrobacterales bacterium]|jgi:AcrR family transcriptional regulator|nr:TetR/AcrR family transcriptional regulator [Solirubrobacterales bacterium]
MAGQREDLVVIPTGRHGLPANVVAEHQRERLLAATIQLVAKRGYRGTSVDHIVKAAKVGYVAFYDLFDGKQACFLAAFDRIVTETSEELAAAVSPAAPWSEQVCAGLARLVASIAADPGRARVALVEVQAAGPVAFARYQQAIDAAIPKLREGRAFRPEAANLSDALEEGTIGAVAWIFHQGLVQGEGARIAGLLGQAIQMALAPYLGEAEAHRIALANS